MLAKHGGHGQCQDSRREITVVLVDISSMIDLTIQSPPSVRSEATSARISPFLIRAVDLSLVRLAILLSGIVTTSYIMLQNTMARQIAKDQRRQVKDYP